MPASSCRIDRTATCRCAQPADALDRYLEADPELAARFADARAVAPPTMLGPMAVDTSAVGEPGLLLAGDAAGFIDPMTGDGLRFALVGAELARRNRERSARRIAADRSRAPRARGAPASGVSIEVAIQSRACARWWRRRPA